MPTPLLKRLMLGLAAIVPIGCGTRSYREHNLLDPCITDAATLTVYVKVETGTKKTSDPAFNPMGPRTTVTVERADLYRADFKIAGGAAAFLSSEHVLGLDGRPLEEAITAGDGFLALIPPPGAADDEMHTLAPRGNGYCVVRDGYTVYTDTARTTEVDRSAREIRDALRFTWMGDQLYYVETDVAGRVSRIHRTKVGSGGVWDEMTYDAALTPIDAHPGRTYVEGYDLLDGEPVLLLRKSYDAGAAIDRGSTGALLRGGRLVATWSSPEPGWIRPDIRAFVGWTRSYGSLRATLTLRSLDDGSLRTIPVDATPAVP